MPQMIRVLSIDDVSSVYIAAPLGRKYAAVLVDDNTSVQSEDAWVPWGR